MPKPDISPLQWTFGPVRVWLRPHRQRERGEPCAREVLAQMLDIEAATLPIQRDARGKPYLDAPYRQHAVNWSHSGEALLIAHGLTGEIGVDVERHRPRPRMMEIARRFFHASEMDWLRAQEDDMARAQAFLRLWCAKEALLKAHGHGVSFGLEKLVFGEREQALRLIDCDPALGSIADWHLREWEPSPGYRAALAWRD